jgi:light-regulated signal transduction histidine kinase (bacteriophytochrome)
VPHSRDLLEQSVDHCLSTGEWELQEFSYIVSHDLAASFRHVAEFSRLLVGEFGEGLTAPQQAYAARVSAATAKCQLMMEQLLIFSRVQQKSLENGRHDAALMMELALSHLAPEVRAAGAEVLIEPLGEIEADPELLTVIFQSLLDNAIKFHRTDVRPRIAVQSAHDDVFWRVRIIDNGMGIEPVYREKAFRMFHRLNGEDAYPGVGAGLAICRRIARRHGGDLRFLDCADGACVELALPQATSLQ